MSYRFMRLLIFFDLPVLTVEDRRNYRHFRKNLIKNGFYMLQESVYCRMLINNSTAKFVLKQVQNFAPDKGLVNGLTVTEKQFAEMEYITGEKTTDVIDTDERTLVL